MKNIISNLFSKNLISSKLSRKNLSRKKFSRKKLSIALTICMLTIAMGLSACGKKEPEMDFLTGETLQAKTDECSSVQQDFSEEAWENSEEKMVTVFVCGCVYNPGLYSLPENSRINDALEAAGGFTEEADRNALNLATIIEDGQQIYFPEIGEEGFSVTQSTKSSLIDINVAGVSELCSLPGIGESRAKDIVSYREKNGRFQKKEDIMKVAGIKESTYDKITDFIAVGK